MDLVRFEQPEAWWEAAREFLSAHEAPHNLMLGIGATLINNPGFYTNPYLAVVREGDSITAVALMTPPHNLVLSIDCPREAMELIAADLAMLYSMLPGVLGPNPVGEQFAGLWSQRSSQPFHRNRRQRIYQLEQVRPVTGVPGRMRPITEADRELLIAWFTDFNREALAEESRREAVERLVDGFIAGGTRGLVVWEVEGQVVSMAGWSGPTPTGVRVVAVYTPPAQRKRGYASACVAALSRQLLDSGKQRCFLFTDLDNPTSNRIYQEIGYRPICDMDEYRFSPAIK